MIAFSEFRGDCFFNYCVCCVRLTTNMYYIFYIAGLKIVISRKTHNSQFYNNIITVVSYECQQREAFHAAHLYTCISLGNNNTLVSLK